MFELDVDSLKSKIKTGLALQSRFAVTISPPAGILSPGMDTINALCQSTSLPTRSIDTTDYSTVRQSFKLPKGYTNADVNFTFLLTNDYAIKNLFDTWLGKIVDTSSYRIQYVSEYVGTITVMQLDLKGNPIYQVKLIDAYPTSMEALPLDSGANNQFQRLSVNITYYDSVIESPQK